MTPSTPSGAERRDTRARTLRDFVADHLHCHPRRVGSLTAPIAAAMLVVIDESRDDVTRSESPSRPPWPARSDTPSA